MLKYRGGLDLGERYGVLVRAFEYQLTSIGIKCEMKRVTGMKMKKFQNMFIEKKRLY